MTTPYLAAHTERAGMHAIVIGGSIAGLLAARVLADHFERVTLIERDRFPAAVDNRKGVPQGRHIHQLLGKGYDIVARLFPDLPEALYADGATPLNLTADMRGYQAGHYRTPFASSMVFPLMSRPFLEQHVRRRVLALRQVVVLQEHAVAGLIASRDRSHITGVTIQPAGVQSGAQELSADLIVDASGRGSRGLHWLTALGYEPPPETVIPVDLGYASSLYRLPPGGLRGGKFLIVQATPPRETRAGIVALIEDNRWLVTLGGWLGDHPPADEAGFLAYAHSLPAPDVYEAIRDAEPLSDIAVLKYPASRRHRYERLKRFPGGYVVLGDALCSFNPIYGQGMTAAALEADTLDQCLRTLRGAGHDVHALARRYFRQAARVVETPWRIASGVDLQFPQLAGPRPLHHRLMNWYMSKVRSAMLTDPVVEVAFLKVIQLLEPPSALFAPGVIARVLGRSYRRDPRREHMSDAPALDY